MPIPLIISSLYDLSSVRLVLFFCRIRKKTHVVVNIKVEQWTRFAAGFVDNKVVERVVLVK
jgi:hypothetical protein